MKEVKCISCAVGWGDMTPEASGAYRVGDGTKQSPYEIYPLCDSCLSFAEDVVLDMIVLWREGVSAI